MKQSRLVYEVRRSGLRIQYLLPKELHLIGAIAKRYGEVSVRRVRLKPEQILAHFPPC